MEATEVTSPNGDIERTIILNPEESNIILSRMSPQTREEIIRSVSNTSDNTNSTPYSEEELERIFDEAVGITDNIHSDAPPVNNPELPSQEEILREYSDYEAVEDITEEENNNFYEEANRIEEALRQAHTANSQEEIPTQSESIAPAVYNTQLNSMSTARFSSAEWFRIIHEQNITIGGAGGISSWLAFLLARTNAGSFMVYDNDTVEEVNLAGQFFGIRDIGRPKVVAVEDHVREFVNYYRFGYYKELYQTHSSTTPVMMCGFDNMEARKVFFNNWKRELTNFDNSPEHCLFLDGRLSAECFQVLCVQGDDPSAIEAYNEHYLFSDDMADATVCSYKQTSFMSNMIAATMVNVFVNWCANQAGSFRPVPFFIEYDAVTMQYKFKINAI